MTILGTFILLLAITFVDCTPASNLTAKTDVSPTPSHQREVKKEFFSILVPESFEEREVTGEDSNLWEFSDERIVLEIESGPLITVSSTDQSPYSNYSEQWMTIDGERIEVKSFNYGNQSSLLSDPSKNNFVSAYFPRSSRVKSNLLLRVSFASEADRKTVHEIIQSVRFR